MEPHPIETSARIILLDIEGTTSSVRFVYDEMFPFVRRELAEFLDHNAGKEAVVAAAKQIALDGGKSSLKELVGSDDLSTEAAQQKLTTEVIRQMDADLKATGLKDLQGQVWEAGFRSGDLRAHVYDEVPGCMRQWKEAGKELRIYSSGSIQAQKLFFGHTVAGNLLPLLSGHYDTTIGSKREAGSYTKIVEDLGCRANEVIFLSDIVAELDAAKQAGLQTVLVLRPGNAQQENPQQHPSLQSFAELAIGKPSNS
ncbi:Enolase-phosphatase E1 [Anatilimnocola aggregata]|uniref:Enolase-phosphatase E1 n=1 Tax=Anatilimnocola aggregata TaxID=2528021 RepID=A0A517YEH7_9BACT|nr:acireductone synthase [Anatilimnocola aggregata]QDU28650.1 Enolase-phosphatase E1 [Anatilimnocola aggregata]